MKAKWLLYGVLWLVTATDVLCQKGNYYLTNFSPDQYGGSDQNWCSLQDKWGRIYIANGNYVIMNDGKKWKPISLRNASRSWSLDKNAGDTIFVGGETEFGYLAARSNGRIEYESLSKNLKKGDDKFTNVWAVRCIRDEVYFCSNEKIFLYKNGKIKAFSPETEAFHTFFKVRDHLFVREKQVGFKVFVDGELKKVRGSEQFATERVDFILPYKGNIYWVGCRNLGMHLLMFDEEDPTRSAFSKMRSPVDEWMKTNEVYCGTKINEHNYAIGSLNGGLMITDENFKPINIINTENGLQDNGVKNIFVDVNENLWLSLNLGISMVEFNIPITRWIKNNGVNGIVESSVKFNGNLYITTSKGLEVLDKGSNKFLPTEILEDAYDLCVAGNDLLIATSAGLYNMHGSKIDFIHEETVYSIYINDKDPETLYLGTEQGLVVGNYSKGKFSEIKRYDDWGSIRSAAGNSKGEIAFGTSSNGVYVLNTKMPGAFQHIDTARGLCRGANETTVFNYKDELLIDTDSGFYKIENTSPLTCKRSSRYNPFSSNVIVGEAARVGDDIWFQSGRIDANQNEKKEISTLTATDGGFKEDHLMLSRIKGVDTKDIFCDSGYVYLSTNDGLYCYDLLAKPKKHEFFTFISKISFGKDTLSEENLHPDALLPNLHIPYAANEIAVIPAASDYYDKASLEFCWYLEGKEEGYGAWSTKEEIQYNNLFEGTYTLFVKSRNILGQEGKEVSLKFTILPPVYRTWWAYIIYTLAVISVLFLLFRWRTAALRERQKQLEKTVEERTAEVVLQKEEAEHQKELVQEKQKEIMDSINYARRIQYSQLAGKEVLDRNLKEYFLFFKPKDVVSGDFYWASELSDGKFALVAADSTGHGVPGAIMSILNISCLNEAVIADKKTEPADIFNSARKKIITHLMNDGSAEGGKDGMDASLISFDLPNKKFTYAAANNPVWIVRGKEFIPLKADRMPVGKHDKDTVPFMQNDFDLQEGDMVYQITDGFPDQFGGPKGKKFKYKQLEELLVSIAHLPAKEQKEKLDEAFVNWIGELEQVDDVTIIGVRV